MAMSKAVMREGRDFSMYGTTIQRQTAVAAQPPHFVQMRNDIVHDVFKDMHPNRNRNEAVWLMMQKVKVSVVNS